MLKRKQFFVLFVIFTLVVMYGVIPRPENANAVDSMTEAKDTISDSDLGIASTTHTFTFTSGTSTPELGFFSIVFPSNITPNVDPSRAFCGIESYQQGLFFTASTTGQTVDCIANAEIEATSTKIVVYGTTNPSEATSSIISIRLIGRQSWESSTTTLEQVQVAAYFIEDVTLSATVDANLTFAIAGTSTSARVNGVLCSNESTAVLAPLGSLVVGATSTVCQDLTVTTNAVDGYTVTVWADNELTSDGGANINSFNNSPDDTGTTTAVAWASPNNTLGEDYTYGHMGLTSSDYNLYDDSSGVYNSFAPADNDGVLQYAGLNDTDPLAVMHNGGPSDGTTLGSGYASVMYQVEVGSLQEAGDYQNTMTYICTPQY